MKKVFLYLFSLSSYALLYSQDSLSVDYSKIQETEVSIQSNRVPLLLKETGYNTTIISQSDIKKIPGQTINDVLAYAIGIDLRQRGIGGVQADIGIQGSGFDQVLILVNGVRVTDAQTGHNSLNLPIPLEAIDRIEVMKGANARRYGLNAMAGVINIITKTLQKNQCMVNVFSGSNFEKNRSNEFYTNQGARIFASISNKSNTISSWFSSGVDQSNGYRHNSNYLTYRNIGEINFSLFKGKAKLNLLGGAVNNKFGANGFYAAPGDSNSTETLNTSLGNIKLTGLSSKLGINYYLGLGSRMNYDHYIYRNENPSYSQNFHHAQTYMPELGISGKKWNTNFAVGLEGRYESIQSSNLGSRNRSFLGAFIDVKRYFGKDFVVSGGLYYLQNSILGRKIYPGIEMNYKLNNRIQFFGNVGTGQRLPTFTDLYYIGQTNVSNPNLLPENAVSSELGFKYGFNGTFFSLSAFNRNTDNLIDWVRPNVGSKWSPINYNKNTFLGWEAKIDFPIYKPLEINFHGSYCHLNAQNFGNDQLISKNALNYLRNQAVIGLDFKILKGLNANIQCRIFDRNVGQTTYKIFSGKLTYAVSQKLNTYLNFQNINNIQFAEISTVPLPSRWTMFGVAYKL